MRAIDLLADFAIRNLIAVGAVGLLSLAVYLIGRSRSAVATWLGAALAVLSGLSISVLAFLFANHVRFPLFLDLMEGTIFQHFQRAASLRFIYTDPTPEFVPLAYNSLFYVVAVPFSWIFGEHLSTLRLVSIIASCGIAVSIFLILKIETGSRWWGLVGAGLFAASYQVMDSYLDTAHSDACFVLCSIAGSAVIHYRKTREMRLLGLLILISSFWFKQHGALFAIGAVLYLTWDEGWRRSWPYWLLAFTLGPFAYLFIAPQVFGPQYHFFTYLVPRGWSEFSLHAVLRFTAFFVLSYFWLALASVAWIIGRSFGYDRRLSLWQVQWCAALATALMGSFDPGSSNNVFIPFATWLVLTGTLGFSRFGTQAGSPVKTLVSLSLLVTSFALVAYDPMQLMRSWRADESYRDFVHFINGLDGTVYAPTLGQLPADFTFYPGAHWVALEDLVRGPGRDTRNHPVIRDLLQPLLTSERPVYILENHPLTSWPWFQYLNDHFILEKDLGDRFRPLAVLPSRLHHGWPRYLYRLDPDTVSDPAGADSGLDHHTIGSRPEPKHSTSALVESRPQLEVSFREGRMVANTVKRSIGQ